MLASFCKVKKIVASRAVASVKTRRYWELKLDCGHRVLYAGPFLPRSVSCKVCFFT